MSLDYMTATTRAEVLALVAKRERLEGEIEALVETLDSQNVGMDGPLLTPDGFPRNDIDIPTIRETRVRVLRLRNDLRALMDEIEQGLHLVFAPGAQTEGDTVANAANGSTSSSSTNGNSSGTTSRGTPNESAVPSGSGASTRPTNSTNGVTTGVAPIALDRSFALIDSVEPNSPASEAGLHSGDEVVKFGRVTATTVNPLRALPGEIQPTVDVQVLRQGHLLDLTLHPNSNWGGRGSLGCHLLPI